MANKKNNVTHYEAVRTGFVAPELDVKYEHEEQVPEYYVEEGIRKVKYTTKIVKVGEQNKGLSWRDFSIDSLSANGAISQCNFVSMSKGAMLEADAMSKIDLEDKDNEKEI